jgi:O-antigen biosynthesis protein WbqP
MIKRLFDIAAAATGLVLLAPVMAVVAILVARETPGGALFAQTRVGRNERPFTCYKFRTMARGAPQLWNVLRG